MKLNLLNKEELTNLYKDEMMFDFPRAELKPLRAMLRLMDMGQYDPLLVTDDQGVALGYAMIWLPRARNGALLEYLGVLRGKRNGGLGSQVLPLLAARYGQLFGEAEAPTSDDRQRMTCAGGASPSMNATVSGCWTMSAPCSASTSTACTWVRRPTTVK